MMLNLVTVFALLQVVLAPVCVVGAYVFYGKGMKTASNVCSIFAFVFFSGAIFLLNLADTMQNI